MLEDFKVELASREPLLHDEMPARYTTRWKWLLSPHELIILHVYDAKGIDEKRLGVHYEYAQTQWFLNAQPGDSLTWQFKNDTDGDFTGMLHLASLLKDIPFAVQVDDQEAQQITFPGSDGWEHFVPIEFQINGLPAGEHRLRLSVSGDVPILDGNTLQVRDIELTAENCPE